MKKLITILTVTFLFILSPIFGQWQKYIIDNNLPLATTVAAGDINGDNIMDVLATSYKADKVNWYENNPPAWVKHSIDANLYGAAAVQVGDIDNDGDLDVVATAYGAHDVVWFENPTWTKHTIDANLTNVVPMIVADIDNDDTLDVIAAAVNIGDIAWYENNHPTWTKHSIASNWGQTPALHVCDIDGDESPDVLATGSLANQVAWFKNENNGLSWTEYTIDDNLNGAWFVYTGDIDNNDTIDVIATGELANDVVWYKNNYPVWTKYTIDSNLIRAKCFKVFDIDDDEKPDVVAVGFTSNGKVVWYKNNYPDSWEKLVIDPGCNGPNYPVISDIDGDNAPDVVVAIENGEYVAWYKNPYTKVAFAESMEVDPICMQTPDDTLKVIVGLSNPEGHQVTLYAVIQGDQLSYLDSLQLFDDGLHNDGDSADNIFGDIKLLEELQEDSYTIDLVTQDLTSGNTHYYLQPARFINFGPVAYEDYSFNNPDDTVFSPGESLFISLVLVNNSSTATATNIKAGLVSLDTLVSVSDYLRNFDNITAGGNAVSKSTFRIKIDEGFPVNKQAGIIVNIYCYDHICWSDTFHITVLEPSNIEDIREPITRIYPNPTDNILNIEISNAGKQGFEIEICTVTGALIHQKEYRNIDAHFTEQIGLSGYAKGIYLLKVKQIDAVYVGKIVVR